MERDLKFCLCGNPSEKQIRKSGLIVYRGICSTCLTLKRRNIPDYVNKEWLERKHIIDNLSLEKIAEELNIKNSHVEYLLRIYNIKEIKHCKYCDTTENLRQCKVNNKWMNEKNSVHKVCQSCYEKIKHDSSIEGQKKLSEETKIIKRQKYNQHYINDPDKKKKEIEKQLQTKANKPIEEIEKWKQDISNTKKNRTEEQEAERIAKFQESMNNKSEKEKQLRLERMGKGVSENHQNRTQESWDESRRKCEETWIKNYGIHYCPYTIQRLNEEYEKKKDQIKLKSKQTLIKNGSFHKKGITISKKAFHLFNELDLFFKGKYNFLYDIVDIDTQKRIQREKPVYVEDLNLSNNTCRFLDFYFINENNQEVCIEFDEKAHEHIKNIEKDLIREMELFLKKPNLIIFRVKEKYYNENYKQVLEDLINLIKNPYSDTFYNYDCLTVKNKKASN